MIDYRGSHLQLINEELNLASGPNISPDGSRIAYAAKRESGWLWWRTDSWEIMTARPDGSDRRQLTKNNRMEVNPIWISDGNRIAFMYLYQSGRGGVYAEAGIHDMAIDGSDLRQVLKFVDLDPVGTSGIGLPIEGSRLPTLSLSPDGSRLAFVAEESWSRFSQQVLFVVGVNGSDAARLAEKTGLLAWSPDGHRIAYTDWQSDSQSGDLVALVTISVDGSDPREITSLPKKDLSQSNSISWSPDGSAILIGSHVVEVDGLSMRRLPGPGGHTRWSPDGSLIAVYAASHSADMMLYMVAADGSDARVLVEEAADGTLVAANGRKLQLP